MGAVTFERPMLDIKNYSIFYDFQVYALYIANNY